MVEGIKDIRNHVCNNICREWHRTHLPRGYKPNTIPAGDKRHVSDEVFKKAEERRNKKKKGRGA